MRKNYEWLNSYKPVITHTKPEMEMYDVMNGDARQEIKCLDHGFVALVDAMPRFVPMGRTADFAAVQAARTSYGQGTKQVSEDTGLTRYLVSHHHNTPIEMIEFKFHLSMPIFCCRQWVRHRTASLNEYSGRYSVMPDKFYRPDQIRGQNTINKQASEGLVDNLTASEFLLYLHDAEDLYQQYESLLKHGVSRELARIGLPVSLYTEFYWKIDLHNLLHFLQLRMESPHAQEEIRIYAGAILRLIEPIVPVIIKAFFDYRLNSISLSDPELAIIKELCTISLSNELISEQYKDSISKREMIEFLAKLDDLSTRSKLEN